MDLEGWRPDPFGVHEERPFRDGEPMPLVRGGCSMENPPFEDHPLEDRATDVDPHDQRVGSGDEPLWLTVDPTAVAAAPDPVVARAAEPGRARTSAKRLLAGALALVALGAIVEVMAGGGRGAGPPAAQSGATTTTFNVFVRWRMRLPVDATITSIEDAFATLPSNTTLTSIENALAALPKAAHSAATAPAAATTTTAPPSTSTQAPPRPRPPAGTGTAKPTPTVGPTTAPTAAPTRGTAAPTTTTESATTTSEPATTTSQSGSSTTSAPDGTTTEGTGAAATEGP